MKKVITILTLLLILLLVGSLYNTLAQLDKVETVTTDQAYMAQFPDQMSDVIMDPMVGFPLY